MRYYLLINDQTDGPHDVGYINRLYSSGSIAPDVLCCAEGDDQWRQLSDCFKHIHPDLCAVCGKPFPATRLNRQTQRCDGCLADLTKQKQTVAAAQIDMKEGGSGVARTGCILIFLLLAGSGGLGTFLSNAANRGDFGGAFSVVALMLSPYLVLIGCGIMLARGAFPWLAAPVAICVATLNLATKAAVAFGIIKVPGIGPAGIPWWVMAFLTLFDLGVISGAVLAWRSAALLTKHSAVSISSSSVQAHSQKHE